VYGVTTILYSHYFAAYIAIIMYKYAKRLRLIESLLLLTFFIAQRNLNFFINTSNQKVSEAWKDNSNEVSMNIIGSKA